MICPQTKAECGHLAFCDITGKCMEQEVGTMDQVDAEVRRAISRAEPPPPPTLADIERLAGDVSLALSALMAAIRAYGRE